MFVCTLFSSPYDSLYLKLPELEDFKVFNFVSTFSILILVFVVILIGLSRLGNKLSINFYRHARSWVLPISQQFINIHPPIYRITAHSTVPSHLCQILRLMNVFAKWTLQWWDSNIRPLFN